MEKTKKTVSSNKKPKFYVFGDMIAESYLVKKERHGYNMYEQNTELKIIPAGTRIFTDFIELIQQAKKGEYVVLKHENGVDYTNSEQIDAFKNSCFGEWEFNVPKLKHAALRDDTQSRSNTSQKCCPYSYSTLCKKRTSLSSNAVNLIGAGDGYERNLNSLSYPDIDVENFSPSDEDVIVLHDKGLAFANAFLKDSYENLVGKKFEDVPENEKTAWNEKKVLWDEKCELMEQYMDRVFSPEHHAKIFVYCSDTHLEKFLKGIESRLSKIEDAELQKEKNDSITLLLFMDSIRRCNIMIDKRLSWEKTAYDFWKALTSKKELNTLKNFSNVVVFTDMEGAVIYRKSECTEKRFQLIFTPDKIEGDIMDHNCNYVEDLEEVLTLSFTLASKVGCSEENCARFALYMMQKSYEFGVLCLKELIEEFMRFTVKTVNGKFELVKPRHSSSPAIIIPEIFPDIFLPIKFIELKEKEELDIEWSILNAEYKAISDAMKQANNIVKYGPKNIFKQIPVLKIKELEAVNRREIESFRTIKSTIEEYIANPERLKPISLAVFGPPGSGKSFGIKRIISQLKADHPYLNTIETNVSQYKKIEDLEMQFEEIRNDTVRGKLPIVFFDEFDSDFDNAKWGWIKYFLAPMQDGLYIRNGNTNYLGRSIFIFAGATVYSYQELLDNIMEPASNSAQSAADSKDKKPEITPSIYTEDSRKMKVPDFLSRLKGYLNIISINNEENKTGEHSYLIKRALILRNMLTRYGKNLISKSGNQSIANIDDNLLRTLLEVPRYRYGSRSVEQIIQMSELKNEFHFTPSMLPSKEQLMMHIEKGYDFYEILNS